MRTSIPLLVMLFLSASFYCIAQGDSSSANWKMAMFKSVSFKYPGDWVFEKQEIPGNTLLSVTPIALKDRSSMKYVEIICVEPQGHTWADFKREFIQGIAARSEGGIKLQSKKDSTFNKLTAVYAKIDVISDHNSIPITVFAINGKNMFYLITAISFKEKDGPYAQIAKSTEAILDSIEFE